MFTDAKTSPMETPTQRILNQQAERLFVPLRRINYSDGPTYLLASWIKAAGSHNYKDGQRILRQIQATRQLFKITKIQKSDGQNINFALTEFIRFSLRNKLIRVTAGPYTKPALRRALLASRC